MKFVVDACSFKLETEVQPGSGKLLMVGLVERQWYLNMSTDEAYHFAQLLLQAVELVERKDAQARALKTEAR